jgi:hypothetical protein
MIPVQPVLEFDSVVLMSEIYKNDTSDRIKIRSVHYVMLLSLRIC